MPPRSMLRSRFQQALQNQKSQALSRVLTWREDLITAYLSIVLVMGLYLDGWNHINLQANELGAFLTPWHGLLYLGYTLMALWILSRCLVRLPQTDVRPTLRSIWDAAPSGYHAALIGMGMVSIAAPGDAIWHSVFGVETGVARVIGPFHLVLFTGMGLMAATPLWSAWLQHDVYPVRTSFRRLQPALLSLLALGATGGFLVQWSSAFVLWTPSLSMLEPLGPAVTGSPVLLETLHRAAVSQVLLTTAVLMGPLLLAAARWRLPFGSVTLVFCGFGLLNASLNELALQPVLISTLIGGLVADAMLNSLAERPALLRVGLLGGIAPLTMWIAFFVSLSLIDGVSWPRDLWLGATVTAATFGSIAGLLAAQMYERRPPTP